jgi:hypothetical protein
MSLFECKNIRKEALAAYSSGPRLVCGREVFDFHAAGLAVSICAITENL